jgi:hypothetical protein
MHALIAEVEVGDVAVRYKVERKVKVMFKYAKPNSLTRSRCWKIINRIREVEPPVPMWAWVNGRWVSNKEYKFEPPGIVTMPLRFQPIWYDEKV